MAQAAEPVFYEDLAAIEEEFEDIDMEIVRKQYELSAPAYAKRALAIAKIPFFWPLVLEQAPPEIDQYIHPQDSRIFAESLARVDVQRPELDNKGSGSPRSLHFRFQFQPNEYFEDTILEKTFWYRRSKDGWAGLVSEPVRIKWKTDKDLTQGLTDMARTLFEARSQAGDMMATGLPEYAALKKKVEHWNGMNTSFFTWFGWVSGRRWISGEESEMATREHAASRARRKGGERAELASESETAEENEIDDEPVEVHEAGEELAIALAEDLWPNAIKYFTQAQEMDEDLTDGLEMESDLEEEDVDDDDDDDDKPVDIRSLVRDGKGSPGGEPPASKKRKT